MKSIHHSHFYTSVDISGSGNLHGRTVFLSAAMECAASLLVDIRSFKIEKARWETYRGPDGPLFRDIDGLTGVEAYLGSGNALRHAVLENCGEKALDLISETVRGIIQAETFLYRERGYPDAKSYDHHWERMYLNTCRYYSSLDRVSRRWEEHVAVQKRFNNLFNRFKSISVADGEGSYHADAGLSDSFHQVGVNAILDKKTGAVTDVYCRLLRAPDPVCFEAGGFAQNLLGLPLAAMSKREIAATLEKNRGCVHMIDICSDLASVLKEYF